MVEVDDELFRHGKVGRGDGEGRRLPPPPHLAARYAELGEGCTYGRWPDDVLEQRRRLLESEYGGCVHAPNGVADGSSEGTAGEVASPSVGGGVRGGDDGGAAIGLEGGEDDGERIPVEPLLYVGDVVSRVRRWGRDGGPEGH